MPAVTPADVKNLPLSARRSGPIQPRCRIVLGDLCDRVALEAEEDLFAVHVVERARAPGRELDLPQAQF